MKLKALLFLLSIQAHAEPIVITQAGVYSGVYSSDDPNVPAVIVQTVGQVEITYSTITSRGDGVSISVNMCNLSVHDCHFIARNSEVVGKPNGFAIVASNPQRVSIYNNYFRNWRKAVEFTNPPGSAYTGAVVAIDNNEIYDCEGRKSDGQGSYTEDSGCGGAILLNGLIGMPYCDIGWNKIINRPSLSSTGDIISLYACSGQSMGSCGVHDNYVEGIFPDKYGNAAGILTDGVPGSYVSWNIIIANNIVTDFYSSGISMAYSHDCIAYGNRTVSAAINPRTGNLYQGQFLIGIEVYQANSTNVVQNNISGVNQSIGDAQLSTGTRADYNPSRWGYGTWNNNSSYPYAVITKQDEHDAYSMWDERIKPTIGPR